ncbi:hypothetical protein [Rubritalea tangerina]|uniref:Uncharacterized protein n=1 Tax=Rubritalea tangerina TaxID=430798 RepID=A0ABW4ZDE1_9BACT
MKRTIVNLLALSLIVTSASAQIRAKVGPKHKNNHRAKALIGDPAEFGALTDKFREHQRLTSGGGAYYEKSEAKLRAEHAQLYRTIQFAVTEDRISEEDARDAIASLLTIGQKHLAGGDASEAQATSKELSELKQSIRSKMTDKAPAGTITPKVNRLQFHMEEVIRFGEDTDRLSSGDINSLRRQLDSLESKEDKAKADGTLSDRDHVKLIEESREIWRNALKKFS